VGAGFVRRGDETTPVSNGAWVTLGVGAALAFAVPPVVGCLGLPGWWPAIVAFAVTVVGMLATATAWDRAKRNAPGSE